MPTTTTTSVMTPLQNMRKLPLQPRKQTIYENCKVYAPNGSLMFRCNRDKLDWYLSRNLARPLGDDQPNAIILTFEPRGSGNADSTYYLEDRENLCVVCGIDRDLTVHHVVPYVYRKHMPERVKSHSHHDALVLCVHCHDTYTREEMVFKKQLADKYGVPLEGKGWIYHKERRGIRMACNALKNYRDKMPQARTQELEKRVGEYYHRIDMKYDQDEGTYTGPSQEEEGEDIQAASNGVIERKTEASMDELVERGLNEVDLEQGSDFIEHGEAVVSSMTSDAQIEDFVKMWRRHFLQHLQPKHLSAEWDVDAPVFRT